MLIPANSIGVAARIASFAALSIHLTHAEQIVKTSGNLFASFLIQGGGLKFYQGEGQSSENYIIKAKLVGSARFHWKNLLEHYRENGTVVFVFVSSFGFDAGFIINSLEVNIQNTQRGIFNCTISLQKVQEASSFPRLAQGLLLAALDSFTSINIPGLDFFSNRELSNRLVSLNVRSLFAMFNSSLSVRGITNLPVIIGEDNSVLNYKQNTTSVDGSLHDEDDLNFKQFGEKDKSESRDQI